MDVKLAVVKGKTSVKEIPLGGGKMIIGRKRDCNLCIPSSMVSRLHCELSCEGSSLRIKDLGSSNGTFVNGSKVKEKELKPGDTLGIGPVTFLVRIDGAPASPDRRAKASKAPVAAVQEEDEAADFFVVDEPEGAEAAGVDHL